MFYFPKTKTLVGTDVTGNTFRIVEPNFKVGLVMYTGQKGVRTVVKSHLSKETRDWHEALATYKELAANDEDFGTYGHEAYLLAEKGEDSYILRGRKNII